MKYIVILALLFAYVHSRALTACPDLPTPRNFDATKYVGDWYDIAHYDGVITWFEKNGCCIRANYTPMPEKPGHIKVRNTMRADSTSGPFREALGEAYAPDAEYPAKLRVSFGSVPWTAPYNVIETDYENYALVYSCVSPADLYRFEAPWILARKPTIPRKDLDVLLNKFQSYGVDKNAFVFTNHTNCKYDP